jgi:hypothetical protein
MKWFRPTPAGQSAAQSFFPHLFSGRYKSLVVAESRSAWGWELAAI